MRVRITRPSRLRSNFRKVKRAIRDASSRSCEAARAAAAAAAEARAEIRRGVSISARRGGQANAEPASIARFLAFFSEARERAPRPWRMECGRGESRRVPARCARCVWHGMVWIYTRTRADTTPRELKRRSHGPAPPTRTGRSRARRYPRARARSSREFRLANPRENSNAFRTTAFGEGARLR